MQLLLLRYGSIPGQGIPGKLIVEDFTCKTIEREWADNQPFISSIPAGTYKLERHTSPKYGNTWALVGDTVSHYPSTKKRYSCLIHSANYASELQGCIAPGKAHGGHDGHFMVTNSRNALKALLDILAKEESHELVIKWEHL